MFLFFYSLYLSIFLRKTNFQTKINIFTHFATFPPTFFIQNEIKSFQQVFNILYGDYLQHTFIEIFFCFSLIL
jgi:hypothetical protein